MLTKILVFTLTVAIASCSDHHYLKRPHDSHKEYRHPYKHRIQVQEPSSEEYKPEHGHAYSSQSVVHQGQAYEESHESEHVAPYQYKVNENSEESANQEAVQQKYRYPQHEIQTVRVPAHKTYYSEAPVHQAHTVYASSQEGHKPAYHPEPQEAHKAYYQPESHETPQKVQYQSHEPIYVPEHASHEPHESHDEPIDYYAYPKYQYEYKVEDPHTGDNKFQHEVRDGDVVKGVYGLHEPDGSIRTVEYSSDKHHGFSAIVKHSAPGQHVQIETHHQNEHQHEHQN